MNLAVTVTRSRTLLAIMVSWLVIAGSVRAHGKPDSASATPGLSILKTAGAEAMGPLMHRLGELFGVIHPGAQVIVDASGPPRAPAGLATGAAQIGFTGRTFRPAELAAIVETHGRPPLQFLIGTGAYDNKVVTHTMAVVVSDGHPLQALTLAQVRVLFSSNTVPSWAALGLSLEWANRPVNLYAGKFGTGAAEFVRETVFLGDDWSRRVREFPTDEAAIEALRADGNGLALVGLGFVVPGTRALALATDETTPAYVPSRAHVESRQYPLARLLYFHVRAPAPGERIDPLVREFLRLVLSQQGQREVAASGYLALPAAMVEAEREKLAWW
jgi:phosphate transport system substrate-binding protein